MIAKRHISRLEQMLKHFEQREAALFSHYGPHSSGTQRSVDLKNAEALRVALAALASRPQEETK